MFLCNTKQISRDELMMWGIICARCFVVLVPIILFFVYKAVRELRRCERCGKSGLRPTRPSKVIMKFEWDSYSRKAGVVIVD